MFILLLILIALSLAGSSAYFSIYGLAYIFDGALIPVIIMGSSLEAGKLIATSFLYRYWKHISLWLKTYLCAAILVLMFITSLGIYGFLLSAHQKNTIPLKEVEQKIKLYDTEKAELQSRLRQIDNQIAELPSNYVRNRIKLTKLFDIERKRIDARNQEITANSYELQAQLLDKTSHIGPIVYIAKALGKDTDTAISYMIMLIMFSFDPLAVALTIAINSVFRIQSNKPEIESNYTRNIEYEL